MSIRPISPLLVLVPVRSAHQDAPLFLEPLGERTILDSTLDAAERQRERAATTTIITTDDERVADYVREHRTGWGVRLRDTKAEDRDYFSALKTAFDWASQDVPEPFEAILILEPSHPFRPSGLVANALSLMQNDPGLDTIVSVVREYGNLWTRSPQVGLTRTVTRPGEEFYREVAGLALLNRREAMSASGAMGKNVGFVVVEEQWALIDIHGGDGVATAQRFNDILTEGRAGA
jgi:hypothetical protein